MNRSEPHPHPPAASPCTGQAPWQPGFISLAAAGIPIERLSPASLAYLGDAVYELYARTRCLLPPKRMVDYHRQVVARVRAEAQADCLRSLAAHLTETEREIVRRGRNAASTKHRRLSPEIYQQATSLETLIGYLYLEDPQRLQQLLEMVDF